MKVQILRSFTASIALFSIFVFASTSVVAQTQVNSPKNKYKVQDDVKLGNDAARQVEKQFPILNDVEATNYVASIGERLVAAIPSQFRQPSFDYRFKIVNASDINAFALPGGPMYVNRGMIEAARNEGEIAGVMAHEISHVALRHATAQQTKLNNPLNQILGIGAVLGGYVLGGQTGAQLGQVFASGYFLKYSREYETQADILGARIMADSNYDPRDLANMFQTIAKQGGGRSPEWLSSHPDPGNRYEKINREASLLRVSSNPYKITRDFERLKAKFRTMPPARSMAQIEKDYNSGNSNGQTTSPTASGRYSNSVPIPSTRVRSYSGGSWFRITFPSNWREFPDQTSVQFAPEGAYGSEGITHGATAGVYSGRNNSLAGDSEDYVRSLLSANTYLRQRGGFTRTYIDRRQGLTTTLSGRSPVTGRTEIVTIYTSELRNGDLIYVVTVVPQTEEARYANAFRNMIRSIRLSD
jgi:Zn-dependent protease with chaperone function